MHFESPALQINSKDICSSYVSENNGTKISDLYVGSCIGWSTDRTFDGQVRPCGIEPVTSDQVSVKSSTPMLIYNMTGHHANKMEMNWKVVDSFKQTFNESLLGFAQDTLKVILKS